MKGARVGTHCNIGKGVFVESGAILGDRVTLKNPVMVWDGVRIEDDAFIGPGVISCTTCRPIGWSSAIRPGRSAGPTSAAAGSIGSWRAPGAGPHIAWRPG